MAALALFITFGLNTLRPHIARAVMDATGRELRIDGPLKPVWSWPHPRVRAEQVRFANPGWAKSRYLFQADAVDAAISVLPLLRRQVVVPVLHLEGIEVNLEVDRGGRKNWVLEKKQKEKTRIQIRHLTLDRGRLGYDDALHDLGIMAQLSSDGSSIGFNAAGKYRGLDLTASGHGGPGLWLQGASHSATASFPLRAEARIGTTTLKVDGEVAGIPRLERIDCVLALSGRTLHDLYAVLGLAFPGTGPYALSGRLIREDGVIRFEDFSGRIGQSEFAGRIRLDASGARPFMSGELHSRVLNLADLGPLIGTDQPRKKTLLPDAPFAPDRWASVDADVWVKADTIKAPARLPLESMAIRIRMKDRVLTLNPVEFGVAGGKLAGRVKLDGTRDTVQAEAAMRVQRLRLAKMFPTIRRSKGLAGEVEGLIELAGEGNSVGRMLGAANGKAGLFMDGGQISRYLTELLALDLWHAAAVKLKGDEPVRINCAVADFAVKRGVLETNALVIDTELVLIEGGGTINLKTEQIALKLDPKPKHASLASLNSPLYVRGTLRNPRVSPEPGKVAAKALSAVVLGVINPLLAVLPLLQDKEVEDSPCAQFMAREAAKRPRQK